MKKRLGEPTGHNKHPKLGGFVPDLWTERPRTQVSFSDRVRGLARASFGGVLISPTNAPENMSEHNRPLVPEPTPAPIAEAIQVVEVPVEV